jgi:hypothetical protein
VDRPRTVTVPAGAELELTSTISGPAPATGNTTEVSYQLDPGGPPISVRIYFQPHGNVLPQQ